jgi:hypothetical protein
MKEKAMEDEHSPPGPDEQRGKAVGRIGGILERTLSDTISATGLGQAKITEAEKAVHVGYFFNGKKEGCPLRGEERIIVPTRKDVALFDEAPEMSSGLITEAAIAKIRDPGCRFIFGRRYDLGRFKWAVRKSANILYIPSKIFTIWRNHLSCCFS